VDTSREFILALEYRRREGGEIETVENERTTLQ
jgi:hypothetical protein